MILAFRDPACIWDPASIRGNTVYGCIRKGLSERLATTRNVERSDDAIFFETYGILHHRLRGSASAVCKRPLALSMGNGNFRPPQNRHPSTDHQNICHRWLRQWPLRLCQIRCISVHGGLLGTWVKYNRNYFYLGPLCPFFEELTYTSTDFHAWWLKRCGLAQVCAFLGIFSHYIPYLGSQKPKKNNFGAWIGVFKLNLQNRKTCILSKLLHRF